MHVIYELPFLLYCYAWLLLAVSFYVGLLCVSFPSYILLWIVLHDIALLVFEIGCSECHLRVVVFFYFLFSTACILGVAFTKLIELSSSFCILKKKN